MSTIATAPEAPAATNLARDVGLSALGCAAFGAAAAAGHGLVPMLRGAWAAPALFLGGAALAAPPLYLLHALTGAKLSAADVLRATARSLTAVSAALLGLAAPAAYFSATLRSAHAVLLLTLVLVVAGGAAVIVAAAETAARASAGRVATLVWCVFALVLGARLIASLASTVGLVGAGV